MPQTILVVDDERDIVELVRYNLAQAGYRVVSASDGRQAVEMARRERPDLIVLDLMLPVLPGAEVARTLKQDEKTRAIPILMLTARGDEVEVVTERIVHEPLVIDVGAHVVRLKGKEVGLTATEFKLLHRLTRRPGRAFSRDQLLSEVWGYGGETETRTVDTHMKRLRAKLGPVGDWIQTVRGVGYRFRPAGFEA